MMPDYEFIFESFDDHVEVVGIEGANPTCIAVPKEENGKPVTIIKKYAFKDLCMNTLILPNTIEAVEENVCENCATLDTVIFVGAESRFNEIDLKDTKLLDAKTYYTDPYDGKVISYKKDALGEHYVLETKDNKTVEFTRSCFVYYFYHNGLAWDNPKLMERICKSIEQSRWNDFLSYFCKKKCTFPRIITFFGSHDEEEIILDIPLDKHTFKYISRNEYECG